MVLQLVMQQTPFDKTYPQSYLLKAGVRFDFNIVDTICRRKLSFFFYLVLVLVIVLIFAPSFGLASPSAALTVISTAVESSTVEDGSSLSLWSALSRAGWGYYFLIAILCLYLLFYLLRLSYYRALQAKLRTDDAPIAVESYAVVCLDIKRNLTDYLHAALYMSVGKGGNAWCRYAVIFKELGTDNPRFFLGAAVSPDHLCFIPEQVGRVFIHRRKAYLYSVDDLSAYQTVSKKRLWRWPWSVSATEMVQVRTVPVTVATAGSANPVGVATSVTVSATNAAVAATSAAVTATTAAVAATTTVANTTTTTIVARREMQDTYRAAPASHNEIGRAHV